MYSKNYTKPNNSENPYFGPIRVTQLNDNKARLYSYIRDKNGNGVLAGLTNISRIESFQMVDGKKVPCNKKDPKKPFRMVYRKTLAPGASTKEKDWKTVDFMLPESLTVSKYVIKVTQFEIDHDWIKVIRKNNQPTKKCPVHL